MDAQEFCITATYAKGDIVWFGELKWTANDFVVGETPDKSDKFSVYVRKHKRG